MIQHLTHEPAGTAQATVMLGLACGTPSDAAWKLLLHAARGLAHEQDITVALAGMQRINSRQCFVVDIVGADADEELPVISAPSHSGTTDMQVARALHRLRPGIGLWIVAAPDPESSTFPAMAGIVREWLLATATDNQGLVEGYQFLKRAWNKSGVERNIGEMATSTSTMPSVFLLSDDYAQAALVHKRLRKAAQEFLKTDLRFAGAGPMRGIASPAAASGSSNHESDSSAARVLSVPFAGAEEALWAAVLDELCPLAEADEEPTIANHLEQAFEIVTGQAAQVARRAQASFAVLDHLANVLDPEERAALAMDFEEPGVPVATGRGPSREQYYEDGVAARENDFRKSAVAMPSIAAVAQPRQPVVKAPVELPSPPPVAEVDSHQDSSNAGPTLRAFDLGAQRDRPAQWQAVESSIWDLLPKSVLLEAKPPMSWATDTCIAIDREGRLHVWTLYKDGASWFALREWASEHRNLLALTRRDLTVCKEADVSVHIVLPLQEELPQPISPSPSSPTGNMPSTTPTPPDASTANMVTILMRTPSCNIHLYRLRIVHWHARRGMVVVPLI